MDFTVKVEGIERLIKSSNQTAASIENELARALLASGLKVEADAKKSIMQGGKSGRTYRRGTVLHQASAPGEAPANHTGRLVNSINSYLNGLAAFVVAGRGIVNYAKHLEFGTRNMAPRPFMEPALKANAAWIRDRLIAAVRKGAKK